MIIDDKKQLRMLQWWNGELEHGPLIYLTAKKENCIENTQEAVKYESVEDYFCNAEKRNEEFRAKIKSIRYYADAIPYFDTNLIAGSLAVYLGCQPIFGKIGETVWHKHILTEEDLSTYALPEFDPNNIWWRKHCAFIKEIQHLAGDDYAVGMPGLQENLDTLSEMRTANQLMYDLIDCPETVHLFVERLDELYFKYTEIFYQILKDELNGNFYNGFRIWGAGKTAKLQCDVSALISGELFKEYTVPMLKRQCEYFEYVLYHLDGTGALHHLDTLIEIDGIRAIQWVPGAGNPDAPSECWYPHLDKIRKCGKSLWLMFEQDEAVDDLLLKADKLLERYGSQALYLHFPETDEKSADRIITHAQNKWNMQI